MQANRIRQLSKRALNTGCAVGRYLGPANLFFIGLCGLTFVCWVGQPVPKQDQTRYGLRLFRDKRSYETIYEV